MCNLYYEHFVVFKSLSTGFSTVMGSPSLRTVADIVKQCLATVLRLGEPNTVQKPVIKPCYNTFQYTKVTLNHIIT